MANEPIKYMSIREFVELGFLQEANRRFFHPLGLALEVHVEGVSDVDGSYRLGGIWDYRDDPEGIIFTGPLDPVKADNVLVEEGRHAQARLSMIGSMIQPLDSVKPR